MIPIWFLILSLVVPRIALLIAWCIGSIPPNPVPFWGDVILSILFPRILVLIYIGVNLGTGSVWFIIHALTALVVALYAVCTSAKDE